MVAANSIAMLAAVLKRHDTHATLQADGCAVLGALLLTPEAEAVPALAKAADGVEAYVGSLLRCGQDAAARDAGQAGLLLLAKEQPALVTRIERANGGKFLK